jgi:hypothetical protein
MMREVVSSMEYIKPKPKFLAAVGLQRILNAYGNRCSGRFVKSFWPNFH